jgi:hypothetical protein
VLAEGEDDRDERNEIRKGPRMGRRLTEVSRDEGKWDERTRIVDRGRGTRRQDRRYRGEQAWAGRQGEDGHGIDAGITAARQEADVAAGNNKTSGDDDSGRTGSDQGGDDDWESRDLMTIGGFLAGRC